MTQRSKLKTDIFRSLQKDHDTNRARIARLEQARLTANGCITPDSANNGKWLKTAAGAFVWAVPTVGDIGAAPASGIAPSAISGTAVVTGDARLTDARVPSGTAGGELAGTYPNPTIKALAITDAAVAVANKDGTAATASMRTLGTAATAACAGNDARLSNARTPSVHHTTHNAGQSDAIAPADIGAAPASGIAPSAISGTAVVQARTVNGHALSADVTVSKSDVSLGSVTNDAQLKAADLDTDVTLAADSATKVATQHATKTYADTKAASTQPAWAAPSLLNSWANYSASIPTGYYKDTLGIVHMRGWVKSGTSASAVICTLPVGYRPAQPSKFSGVANDLFCYLAVLTSGDVYAAAGGSTTYTSLDSIEFRAA